MPTADPAVEAARFRPPFAHLTLLLQVPGVDLVARLEAEKGAPLDDAEQAIQAQRVARRPRVAGRSRPRPLQGRDAGGAAGGGARARLTTSGVYLGALALAAEQDRPAAGDAWQDLIFGIAHEGGLPTGKGFARRLRRVPGPAKRPACRLAAGGPAAGGRRGPPA